MKAKYIKHYKDSSKIEWNYHLVIKGIYLYKNKNKRRKVLLRKSLKRELSKLYLIFDQSKSINFTIDRFPEVISKENFIDFIDKTILDWSK